MARRTIKQPAARMYPNQSGDLTNGEIRAKVERLYPSLPYATNKSVVADLLRANIIRDTKDGGYMLKADLIRRAGEDYYGSMYGPGCPINYTKHDGYGGSVPKSEAEQRAAFRRDCFAVYTAAVKASETDGTVAATAPLTAPEQTNNATTEPPVCVTCGRAVGQPTGVWYVNAKQCGRCYKEAEAAAEAEAKSPTFSSDPLRAHLEWSQAARKFCEQRDADGQPLWDWSMRNTHDGMALIKAAAAAGCAAEVAKAVRDSCTMHLPDDARKELGVTTKFDFVAFGVSKYLEIGTAARVPLPNGQARSVCLMMVGPMGSGKSTAAKVLADKLGVSYGQVSMTMGTSPSAFNGRPRVADDGSLLGVLSAIAAGEHAEAKRIAADAMAAGDVTVSQWVRIYTGGGVFLFDEIDAADSNLLLIVNDALSSSAFANAATGDSLTRSDKFIGLAAGNTLGLGADRLYSGRERLDAASLDRWAAGRIRVGYDAALETEIAERMMA